MSTAAGAQRSRLMLNINGAEAEPPLSLTAVLFSMRREFHAGLPAALADLDSLAQENPVI